MKKQTRVSMVAAAAAVFGLATVPGYAQGHAQPSRTLPALHKPGRAPLPGGRLTPEQKRALAAYGSDVSLVFGDEEVPSLLMGQLSARAYPDDPAMEAQAAMAQHRGAFRAGPSDGFQVTAVETGRNGMPRVRLAQTYKGLTVYDAGVTVLLDRDSVTGITGRFVPDLDVVTDAVVTPGEAAASALAYARAAGYENARVAAVRGPVIFVDEGGAGRLAIPVQVAHDSAEGSVSNDVFVDTGDNGTLGISPETQISITPCCATNYIKNSSFEQGDYPWITIHYGSNDPSSLNLGCGGGYIPDTGSCAAWLNGWGFPSEDILVQFVTVPSDAITATLKFRLRIDTSEPIGATANDTLDVLVRDNNGGRTLYPLKSLSNRDATRPPAYGTQTSTFDLTPYRGQTIQIYFDGREGRNGIPTSFFIDNVSLTMTRIGGSL